MDISKKIENGNFEKIENGKKRTGYKMKGVGWVAGLSRLGRLGWICSLAGDWLQNARGRAGWSAGSNFVKIRK